jgi:predicted transcriptional regulator of viral defense system
MTALDLVAYPRHAGGWGNVASVIRDLDNAITAAGIREALRVEPATTDVQRLGYLLERLSLPAPARPLAEWLTGRARTFVPLAPSGPRQGDRDPRWRIIANITVEPD